MTIGGKIKKIRKFRKMTQKELAERIGLGENAANRIAQYECNYRVPQKSVMEKMAEVLDVHPRNFYDSDNGAAEDLLRMLFWMEEDHPGMLRFMHMEHYKEKANTSDDTTVYFHNNDNWPAHDPVGLWFDYGVLDSFLKEWRIRKTEFINNEITKEEYFEWKLNWPQTCDDCGKCEPSKQWRNPA